MKYRVLYRLPDNAEEQTQRGTDEGGWVAWQYEPSFLGSMEAVAEFTANHWAAPGMPKVIVAIFKTRLAAGEIGELPAFGVFIRIQAKVVAF